MIKQAYINGFVHKLAESNKGFSFSKLVDIPLLQNYFMRYFNYPKVEPGEKALSDFKGRILTRKRIADMKARYGTWPTNFIYSSQPTHTHNVFGLNRDIINASDANKIIDKAYKSLYGN